MFTALVTRCPAVVLAGLVVFDLVAIALTRAATTSRPRSIRSTPRQAIAPPAAICASC